MVPSGTSRGCRLRVRQQCQTALQLRQWQTVMVFLFNALTSVEVQSGHAVQSVVVMAAQAQQSLSQRGP